SAATSAVVPTRRASVVPVDQPTTTAPRRGSLARAASPSSRWATRCQRRRRIGESPTATSAAAPARAGHTGSAPVAGAPSPGAGGGGGGGGGMGGGGGGGGGGWGPPAVHGRWGPSSDSESSAILTASPAFAGAKVLTIEPMPRRATTSRRPRRPPLAARALRQ